MPRYRRPAIALCFFLSGAAGLMDEVVWSRYLHLVFGSTSYSIATVVASYMAGLGLGAWLFGRVADSSRSPARLYALLELGIAAYAVLSPWLLSGVQAVFVPLHRALEPGPLAGALIKAGLAFLVLLVPTVLMGGTLPLLARDLVGRGEDAGRGVGLLYGLNTLGAVAGSLLAGFLWVESLGLVRTLMLAAGLNVVAALIVLALGSSALEPAPEGERGGLRALLRSEAVTLVAGLALAAGLGSLVAEVAWTRLLALVIGSSTYSFALVLAGFLLGIGLGSWWIGRRGAGPEPLVRLGWAQLLAAVGAGTVLHGLEWLLRAFTVFQQNPLAGFWTTMAFKAALVLVVVLPATIGMGMSFPLAAAAAGRGSAAVGSAVGVVYAANTVGSIAGSLLGGFLLLVTAGTFATLRFGAWVHAAVAAAAFVVALRGTATRRKLVPLAAVLAAAAFLVSARPWPRHHLSLGLFLYPRGAVSNRLELDRYFERGAVEEIFSREGLSSVIAVWEIGHGRALRNSGKTDAGTGGDMDTQINLGLRPILAHPAPRSVLVIGAGSGVTAAVVAGDRRVESIDLVEIEQAVIDAGHLFETVNHGVYRDPRLHVVLEDGRNHLLTTTRRYDVIISEPSNPWMAGVSNLFTSEFYALVRARLAPGGVFCQWVQQYDMRPETLRRIAATVSASFPVTGAWLSGSSDLQYLAAAEPFELTAERGQAYLAALPAPRGRSLRAVLNAVDGEDLAVGQLFDDAGLRAFAAGFEPYRDDPNPLEFEALRTLGENRWGGRLVQDLARARSRHPPQPPKWAPAGFADYDEGRVRLHFADFSGARVAFERATAARGLAKEWLWLGEAAATGGDAAAGFAAWRRSAEIAPGGVAARRRLAEAALATRDPAAALAELAGVPPPERDADVILLEARASAESGDSASALARLRELTARLPQSPFAARLLEPALAIYRALGANPALAAAVVKDLDALVAAEPRVMAWRTLLGELHERGERFEPALASYDGALAGGPDTAALAGRARCLLRLGRRDEARIAIDRLRHYEPWSGDVYRLDQQLAAGR